MSAQKMHPKKLFYYLSMKILVKTKQKRLRIFRDKNLFKRQMFFRICIENSLLGVRLYSTSKKCLMKVSNWNIFWITVKFYYFKSCLKSEQCGDVT